MRSRFRSASRVGCAIGWPRRSTRLGFRAERRLSQQHGTARNCPSPTRRSRARSARRTRTRRPATRSRSRPRRAARTCCIILLDDVGFGMCSTFGGPVPTPNMDKLANNGLKYTRFHTTALCSPTRGALLAGRNHHSIGTGVIIEMGTGYPRLHGHHPQEHGPGVADAARQRLRHRACSASGTTRRSRTSARPGRSTAGRPASGSTTSTASTRARRTSTTRRCTATRPGAAAEVAGAGLPLHRGHDRRGDRLDAATSAPPTATSRGSATSAPARRPRPAPRPEGVARQVQGQVRPRLGQAARDDPREATGDGHHPQGDEAHAAARRRSRRGTAARPTRRRCTRG